MRSPSPFDGIDAKLDRATTQLDRFIRDMKTFSDQEPFGVRIAEQPSGDLHFVVVDRKLGPPPKQLVLLAGEMIYQMRSCLDHLVYQAVIANNNAGLLEKSRRHQFPIFKTSDDYKTRSRNLIRGVSADAATVIESVQPYHKGSEAKTDPLWILQHLNNTDKHRLIPVAVVALSVLEGMDSQDGIVWVDSFVAQGDVVLEEGKTILRIAKPDRRVRAKLRATIAFDQIRGSKCRPLDPLLNELLVHVWEIVKRFRRLPEFE